MKTERNREKKMEKICGRGKSVKVKKGGEEKRSKIWVLGDSGYGRLQKLREQFLVVR
jgi:hypothetical protein